MPCSYMKAGVSRRESGDSESRSMGLNGDPADEDDDNVLEDEDVIAGMVFPFSLDLVVGTGGGGDFARSLVDETQKASGIEL